MISLQLYQLTKSYGHRPVFDEISLIHQTGILGIAGPNGSGKSTLLKCMAGLLQPNNGQIIWKKEGEKIALASLKPFLGYSAPYISLYKELSVQENLEFLAHLRKIRLENETLVSLLDFVDLAHARHQLFGSLSTGQQQRAKLASSIFHNPSVLLLDEPGSNLDENGKKVIKKLCETFSSKGKLLIIASNNEQELALCDRIFSIEREVFI